MTWEFDFQSDIPLYLQIRNQVVLSIAKGELLSGDKLPTIRALSDESGINMMTISKAYQLLKSEGYVMTDRRSGTVVSSTLPAVGPSDQTVEQLTLLLAELQLQGMSTHDILQLCQTLLQKGDDLNV